MLADENTALLSGYMYVCARIRARARARACVCVCVCVCFEWFELVVIEHAV